MLAHYSYMLLWWPLNFSWLSQNWNGSRVTSLLRGVCQYLNSVCLVTLQPRLSNGFKRLWFLKFFFPWSLDLRRGQRSYVVFFILNRSRTPSFYVYHSWNAFPSLCLKNYNNIGFGSVFPARTKKQDDLAEVFFLRFEDLSLSFFSVSHMVVAA